jgi:hypothetical protein
MKQLVGILFLIVLVAGCKKDKTPTPEPTPAPTKWEALTGTYKVFDITGVFLYEMELSRVKETDTLKIINFDGEFDLLEKQLYSSSYPYAFTIWPNEAIVDDVGNRWDIMGYGTDQTYNNLVNDTIRMFFLKHNTPYWWNDGTTYSYSECKQIAVKQ